MSSSFNSADLPCALLCTLKMLPKHRELCVGMQIHCHF